MGESGHNLIDRLVRLKNNWRQDRLVQRVFRNSGYLFSGNTANLALSVIQSSFSAHLLGVVSLGILGTITVFASTINRLFSFRMGELVVKYVGDYLTRKELDRAATLVKAAALMEAISSILAFCVLLILSPLAARYFTHDESITWLFCLYGLIIPGNLVTETATGILQLDNRYRDQAIINLVQAVLTAAIIIWAFISKQGLEMVLCAYLLGKLVLGIGPAILAWNSLKRMLGKDWWRASFSLLPPWKELLQFSIGTNLSATINLLVRDSELLWVAFFLSPLEVGYYKVALAINNLVLMPISPFISTSYPEINNSVSERKWPQLRNLLKRVTLFSTAWTLLAAFALIVFGSFIIPIYAGAEFLPAYGGMLVLLIGFGIANILFWNRNLLLAFGMPIYPLQIMFWCGLVKMGLAFFLVPRFGYVAEAVLLSGYFVVSIFLIVRRGMTEMHQREIETPI